MGQNSKVPIRIQEICLQIILKFAKLDADLRAREEENGFWIMEYFRLGLTLMISVPCLPG